MAYQDDKAFRGSTGISSYFTESSRDTLGKRIVDIAISSFLLILLAPLFGLIAIAIRLKSSGPVFYRQVRVGKGKRLFQMLKFRTMVQNADQVGGWSTQINDPRITPLGRILRHWSLDELPQLINVLKGEMTLVGPRPNVGPQLSEYTEDQLQVILSVRPGISGLAQVRGRSALPRNEEIACNVDYVIHRTMILDLKILAKTIWVVMARQGVN